MADAPRPDPAKSLPPVVPPTGRMIAQLFLVPGLIVAVAVTVLLGFSWLAGGPRSATGFISHLRDPNVDVRWRAASDLAQVLKRDEALASDVGFGLDLAELLHEAVRDLRAEEQFRPATGKGGIDKSRRGVVQYLAACLGNLRVPVGVAPLAALADGPGSRDAKSDALLRRQAVWALANLGDGLQRYDSLGETRRAEIQRKLSEESAKTGDRAAWAAAALAVVERRSIGPVAEALVRASEADDPFLRQQAALAMTFWTGSAAENARIDEALARLTRDSGHGVRVEIGEKE